ncbi:MAG: DAK2 domain-containing protein [Dehalococcoidia bacterium]|nr:DAK2 domain-containing protein [Dehalococcoidia bacterium]
MALPQPRSAPEDAGPASSRPVTTIDGEALAGALARGAAALAEQADAINVINVFPVPDGDTGTNMSMTMRAAAGAAVAAAAGSPREVARAASDAALMGAKGNSGVILSQFLAGFAAMPDDETLDAVALAAAFERGRDGAYRLISAPREGTILTAMAEAARAARGAATAGDATVAALASAAEAARQAVADSPDLLPVLKEAGVVDSGAQGFYVLLAGMAAALHGEPADVTIARGRIDASWLAAKRRLHGDGGAGFCTEFVLTAPVVDREALRRSLSTMGTSVLVIGGETTARVHIHTADPAPLFAYARTLGAVSHEKADDMQAQLEALAGRSSAPLPDARSADRIAVVAVAAGDGIEALLRSLGAGAVVRGGQTMNPSAGEIAEAIVATGAARVVVLPDNPNIVLAARQAAEAAAQRGVRADVLPARSVPQGVAALVALNGEAPADAAIAAMMEAIDAVSSAEVTRAVRTTNVDGRAVRARQAIALVDGVLAAVEDEIGAAARAAVARMIAGRRDALVTLYRGADVDQASAEALAAQLREAHGCEVEVVRGGQPQYPYLIGVE